MQRPLQILLFVMLVQFSWMPISAYEHHAQATTQQFGDTEHSAVGIEEASEITALTAECGECELDSISDIYASAFELPPLAVARPHTKSSYLSRTPDLPERPNWHVPA